jgi:hypothetical protein
MIVFEKVAEPGRVHVVVSGDEYLILGGAEYPWVTVLTGRWIHDRRALGRTFRYRIDLERHYKRHGKLLAGYVARFAPMVPAEYVTTNTPPHGAR